MPFQFQTNDLFRPGVNAELNACVGDNGGPYDYIDYGAGFFHAGQAIIRAARDFSVPVDIGVYPATFSFRHGTELYLKQLIASVSSLNGEPKPWKKGHDLAKLWDRLCAEIFTAGPDVFDQTDYQMVNKIILDFVEIDPTGQVFRYPEDVKGNAHLTQLRIINVEVLGEAMAKLYDILDGWYHHVEDLRARQREI